MSGIALLGVTGFTGGLVAAELERRGHSFIAVGRDEARARSATAGRDAITEVRCADVTDPDQLTSALTDVRVVISTVGPYDQLGRPVLDTAIRRGCHYIDVAAEQPFLRWAYEDRDDAARAAGVTAVPAAGMDFLVGDLLAHLAAGAVDAPDALHVTYAVRPGPGLVPAASAGSRRTMAGLLGRPGLALQDGQRVEEMLGETRRLAWFPRPVGPSHAATIPGAEVLTVPRHVPGIRTVRTYLAVPGWQAELLQLAGNAARWQPVRRAAAAVLERGRGGPDASRRKAMRWACVAEVAGTDGVGRAWAYGTDVYGFAAVSAVTVAEAILAGRAATGVVPAALVDAPGELLDRLAARSDLLWSLVRPDGHAPRA